MRQSERSCAAREMEAGPPNPGCRTRVQTTGSCFSPMAEVVSVSETAERDSVR